MSHKAYDNERYEINGNTHSVDNQYFMLFLLKKNREVKPQWTYH
jgi:hypothetical protein